MEKELDVKMQESNHPTQGKTVKDDNEKEKVVCNIHYDLTKECSCPYDWTASELERQDKNVYNYVEKLFDEYPEYYSLSPELIYKEEIMDYYEKNPEKHKLHLRWRIRKQMGRIIEELRELERTSMEQFQKRTQNFGPGTYRRKEE